MGFEFDPCDKIHLGLNLYFNSIVQIEFLKHSQLIIRTFVSAALSHGMTKWQVLVNESVFTLYKWRVMT